MEQGGSLAMSVLNSAYKHPENGGSYSEGLRGLIDFMLKVERTDIPNLWLFASSLDRGGYWHGCSAYCICTRGCPGRGTPVKEMVGGETGCRGVEGNETGLPYMLVRGAVDVNDTILDGEGGKLGLGVEGGTEPWWLRGEATRRGNDAKVGEMKVNVVQKALVKGNDKFIIPNALGIVVIEVTVHICLLGNDW
ncbi:hypothetical protein JB92DRAFT_3205025 [Gautieria morchelliformis]|nr:hypothetical protein JB92DRAFT_3205025 [Gautieria morchelliformis]